MLHILKNNYLQIAVSDRGAELKSITAADGTEYLFDSNPTWWKYSSPILFPIVGKLIDNKYRVDGKEFSLPGHGFGRTSDFEFVSGSDSSLTFKLVWNDETLKVYPYKFNLEISYELKDNEIKFIWKVTNVDDKEIYFSIGAHPAFRCPIVDGENFDDCYLEFNKPEKSARIPLNANGTFSKKRIPTLDGTELNLNYDLFKGDALVFDDMKSDEVTIRSRKSDKSLTVRAKNFPYWGIWTPAQGGAPFVCIEPWHGHADDENFTGDFKDRAGTNKLAAGETFNAEMTFIAK
ncbi:MAG: aldose 1-epimerase family protein [Selenomonadaceae bacterium]|nr:aldose 1-epimerase family protein [Selenomonadaceae bacterium]